MENLHRYVPVVSSDKTVEVDGTAVTYPHTELCPVLFGCDQLTAARARGSKSLRASHDTSLDRLEGLIPVVED